MKSCTFWDIILCTPLKINRRFGETYHLHLQGRTSRARTSLQPVFTLVSFLAYSILKICSSGTSVGFQRTTRIKSRDSVVGIATSYELDDRGVGIRVPEGSEIFSTSSRPALESTQPPIQWLPGALSPAVKRPGREDDHSPPASAEV
jgi:hypothetical protein